MNTISRINRASRGSGCARVCALALIVLLLAGGAGAGAFALHDAYAIQRQSVKLQLAQRPPQGFKLALNSPALRQRFAATEPVVGVLPADAQLPLDKPVRMSPFIKPMLEVELAFQLKKALTEPVADVAALKEQVAGYALAVELPDLGLVTTSRPTMRDIIHANAGAKYFMVAPVIHVGGRAPDAVEVSLLRNDEPVLSAKAGSIDDGQWRALLFLVNCTIANGWTILPGQWLLTGAIGGMQLLKPGDYHLDSSIGSLQFRVVP